MNRDASAPPVFICDLDGTILAVNSFPYWARVLLGARFAGLSPVRQARFATMTAMALVARKLGLLNHEALKRGLQSIWADATRADPHAGRRFANELARHVRPSLAPLLGDIRQGEVDAVLATAAAADYAAPLGRLLGFRHVLATPAGRAAGQGSNVREAKRDGVLAFLARQGWQHRQRILLTDHEEDLPLILVCDRSLWFGSETALAALRPRAAAARIDYCGAAVLPGLDGLAWNGQPGAGAVSAGTVAPSTAS